MLRPCTIHTTHGVLGGAPRREPSAPCHPRVPEVTAGARGAEIQGQARFQAQRLAEVWFSVRQGSWEGTSA